MTSNALNLSVLALLIAPLGCGGAQPKSAELSSSAPSTAPSSEDEDDDDGDPTTPPKNRARATVVEVDKKAGESVDGVDPSKAPVPAADPTAPAPPPETPPATEPPPADDPPPAAAAGPTPDDIRKLWKNVAKIDLNGDGKDDVFKTWECGGALDTMCADFHVSDGTAFVLNRAATMQGGFVQQDMRTFSGDFDGDGKTDFAKVFPCGAQRDKACFDVHLTQADRTLSMARWASEQGPMTAAMVWTTGDFNGDGKTDLAKWWPVEKGGHQEWSADVHLSTGNAFALKSFAVDQGWVSPDMQWFTGDFNGDGKTDFAKVWGAAVETHFEATIDVHLSDGATFAMTRWASGQGWYGPDQTWAVADFNGDAKADFAKYFDQDGLWSADVHVSDGTKFTATRWATKEGGFGPKQRWLIGDFNGDAKADYANVFPCGNALDLACIDWHLSDGSKFGGTRVASELGGIWPGQRWVVGDWNGDGKADLGKWWRDPTSHLWYFDAHPSNGNDAVGIQRMATAQGGVELDPDAWRWYPGGLHKCTTTDTFGCGP